MSHVRYMDRTRDYYHAQGYEKAYKWAHHDDAPFTPLKKPLRESRLALISTSQIAVRTWEDQRTPTEKGEVGMVYPIPSDMPVDDLYSQSHSYDRHATTLDDVNAYFPITRLQELQAEGRFGSLGSNAYGVYTGYSQRKTRETDAPQVLERLRQEAVDVALLTPL